MRHICSFPFTRAECWGLEKWTNYSPGSHGYKRWEREHSGVLRRTRNEKPNPPGINPSSEVMGLWILYLMPQNVRFLICKTRAIKSASRIGCEAYVEDQVSTSSCVYQTQKTASPPLPNLSPRAHSFPGGLNKNQPPLEGSLSTLANVTLHILNAEFTNGVRGGFTAK